MRTQTYILHPLCADFFWLLFPVLMMLWGRSPPKCSHFTDWGTVVQRHVVGCLWWHSVYEAKQKSKTNPCIMKSHALSSRLRCLLPLAVCVPNWDKEGSKAALEVSKPPGLNKSPNYARSWTGFWNLLNILFPSSSLKFPFKEHLGKDTLIS